MRRSALSGASVNKPCSATAAELLYCAAVAPGPRAPGQAAAGRAAGWTPLTLVWGVWARWSAGPATTSLRSRCAPPLRACTTHRTAALGHALGACLIMMSGCPARCQALPRGRHRGGTLCCPQLVKGEHGAGGRKTGIVNEVRAKSEAGRHRRRSLKHADACCETCRRISMHNMHASSRQLRQRRRSGPVRAARPNCFVRHPQDGSYQGGTAYTDASGNTIITPNTVGNGNGNFNTNSSNNGNLNGNNGQARPTGLSRVRPSPGTPRSGAV